VLAAAERLTLVGNRV